MVSEAEIKESLKSIIDPDFNQDIVSLGFVQNVQIKGEDVSFDVALTTPACPIKTEFEEKAKECVSKLDGVSSVNINMTTLKTEPKLAAAPPAETLKKVSSIIAISSCKGGVGKSTIAAHMALDLANRGFRVGLVDADIYGPSLPTLFQLPKVDIHTNDKKQLIPIEKDKLKLMSFGFLLGDAPAIFRGPIVTRYIQQILLGTDWGELDYLFIDMPPGTGDVHLTITQTIRLNGAVIITTPHNLSLIDVARGILMFEKVSVPILGVIENMSYFQNDESDKKHFIFGEQGGKTLTDRFGVSLLAQIPVLPQLTHPLAKPMDNTYIMDAVDQTVRSIGKHRLSHDTIPNIYCDEKNITLQWPDGKKETVSNFELRLNSQDALSVDEITGKKLIKPEDIRKDIAAKKVTPLGNYAIGVEWNDGHNAGIYPYRLISELSETSQ